MSNKKINVACIIPTYNGKEQLLRLLDSIEKQTLTVDTFVVDSSSNDGTKAIAEERVKQVHVIDTADFNHGGTRQLIVNLHPGYDVYVFLTQDAYLEDTESIKLIVEPFQDSGVGAVCGRQLPHNEATIYAQHARAYNYPASFIVKNIDDRYQLGIKTAFMSNSFAAYRANALSEVGGFPPHVIFGEDMYVAARMLIANWKIVYAGNALCRHSHNYTIMEEFRRYFDMGVFHAREPWIRKTFGSAGSEGQKFVKSELLFFGKSVYYQWPSVMLRNIIRFIGYKVGQKEAFIPLIFKKKLGMHQRYWDEVLAHSNNSLV